MPRSKKKGQLGYAIVNKRGTIQVDSVCITKRDAQFYITEYHQLRSHTVKRVRVILED
jgi:hypothetical protein